MEPLSSQNTEASLATQDLWAHGHVMLFELGLARPGRESDAAEFCRQRAAEEGPDAADWSTEAVMYQRLAMSAQPIMIIPPARPSNNWPNHPGKD
jgi:hypothetical protein